jgi:hypothetical protein
VLGLVLRALGVPFKGTFDMDFFASWGEDVHRLGLAEAYQPTPDSYLPAAYQVFGLTAGLAQTFDLSMIVALKAVNLAFDVGTLLLLIALLRQWKLPVAYALIYWLNPYFIVTSWLGYADFIPAFFVLLSLFLLGRARTMLGTAVAGLSLGIAAAMKPQPILLVAMLGAFAIVRTVRARRLDADERVMRAGVLMVGSVAVFAAYSAFFIAHGKSVLFLVRSYLEVGGDAKAPLTGNMPNIWYPVADLYAKRGQPVADVFEPKVFHNIAAVVTFGVLLFVAARIARGSDRRPFPLTVVLLFTAGVAILPMLMTRAHENHFFLAGTLAVLVVALVGDRLLTVLLNALLVVQGFHMYGLYGLGENRRSFSLNVRFGIPTYAYHEPWMQTVLACIASVLFVAAAYRLVTLGNLERARATMDLVSTGRER